MLRSPLRVPSFCHFFDPQNNDKLIGCSRFNEEARADEFGKSSLPPVTVLERTTAAAEANIRTE
jgi:hypothetical protein